MFKVWWYLLRLIQILWLLPATVLVWIIYVLPLWLIFRDLKFVRWVQFGIVEFILAEKGLEKWHVRLWRDWFGWSGPCVFIWKGDLHAPMGRTQLHEVAHCVQQFYAGVFFYPIYILISIFIWVFLPSKHAYLDNPFERAARKAAGQQLDLPWPDGYDDSWPWW